MEKAYVHVTFDYIIQSVFDIGQGPGWECKWSSTKQTAALPEGTSRVPPPPLKVEYVPWRGVDLLFLTRDGFEGWPHRWYFPTFTQK